MVYLIHFDEPYKHARHYLGYCHSWAADDRITAHSNGNGAKLIKAVQEAGIGWIIARIWDYGDQEFERHLKNTKKVKVCCPFCNPDTWHTNQLKAYQDCLDRRAIRKQLKMIRKPVKRGSILTIGWYGIPDQNHRTKTHVTHMGRPLCGANISPQAELHFNHRFILKNVKDRCIATECRSCERSLLKLRKLYNL